MSAATGHPAPTLWEVGDAWLRRACEVVGESAAALNVMNVFPVSDADTGSNLKLTLVGIATAVPDVTRASLDAVVQAAVLSAHGNSGAILAAMVTGVCHRLAEEPLRLRALGAGELVADLLQTTAVAARRAVARPVDGTMLTVADAAAAAARDAAGSGHHVRAVAEAAQQGARVALAHTPDQLAVLAAAGVVDSGGQAYVLLLDALVEVLGGAPAQALTSTGEPRPPRTRHAADVGPTPVEYEVMYALRGASPAALDGLREELSELGRSVVVVGDRTVAQVHVHLVEAGAAVEAALPLGSLSRLRITALPAEVETAGRTVIAVVAGAGLADAVRASGGTAVPGAGGRLTAEVLTEAVGAVGGDLVILPNDMESLEVAGHLAPRLRAEGRRVAVIPTVAQVQGLAAMAVHEPTADFESVVVAMSSAAAHTRHGGVTVAESPAMTMAGRCDTGDVLGIVEGDFVEIGTSVVEVAARVLARLLVAGGELVTLVLGADAPPGLAAELTRRVRHRSPSVTVQVLEGGQARYVLLVGLE